MGDADTTTDADAATDADTATNADTATDASTNESHQEPDGDFGTDSGPRAQSQSESVAQGDADTPGDISSGRVRDTHTKLDNPISDSTVGSGDRSDPNTEASPPSNVGADSAADRSTAIGANGDSDTVDRPRLGSSSNTDVTEIADPQRGESEDLTDSATASDFEFIGNFDADDESGFTVDLERDRDVGSPPGAGSSEKAETGESSIDEPFARLQTSPTSEEDQDTPMDREEAFSQLDRTADSLSQLDAAGPVAPDPFEEVGVDAIDPETVWDRLGPDGEPEPSSETHPVDTAEDSDHVIDKRQYCQQCPHFSGPPTTVCEHSGTTIVSVVDPDKFRVRNCPIVEADAEETDQTL